MTEKEANQMRMAEYMEHKIGQTLTGTIVYIGTRNMKIKIKEGVIGSLNYSDLTDDTYIYDSNKNKLVGKNTKKEYNLGDSITFVVKDASKKNRTINFAMEGYNLEEAKRKIYKKEKGKSHFWFTFLINYFISIYFLSSDSAFLGTVIFNTPLLNSAFIFSESKSCK